MPGKILVIDDEESIGELVQLAMQTRGYRVEYATSGEEGISICRKFAPDVVLVDKRLPDIDGIEVAKKIRQTDAGKRVLLVLMTGDVSEKDLDKSVFVASIEKPVSMSRLTSLIESILGVSKH
jgi:Response regulator containing CheY-like receiver, AAA-type ATPase, and DNA-binding domains